MPEESPNVELSEVTFNNSEEIRCMFRLSSNLSERSAYLYSSQQVTQGNVNGAIDNAWLEVESVIKEWLNIAAKHLPARE